MTNKHKKRTRVLREHRSIADFFHILTQIKLVAIELAGTVLFFAWLYQELLHELRR